MKTNQLKYNRISILFFLTALLLFPFISKGQVDLDINNNVGIGTATPFSKLDVEGGISIGTNMAGSYAAPTDGAIIEGKVGIGTTLPKSKLDVEGGISIGATYSGTTAAPQDGAIIEGKVGIGTAAPVSKLDVEGGISIGATYSGTSIAPSNGAIIEGNVGVGTTAPVSKLDVEGGISIGASYSGTNVAPNNGAIIEGNVGIGTTSPASKLDVEGGISIGATYSGTNPSPLNGAIIQGNVGIGTTAPVARLTVKDAGLGIVNIGQLAGNSLYSGIAFTQTASSLVSGTNYSILGQGSNTYINSPGSGGNIYFRNQNTEQMIILGSSGSVGIGTVAPTALFSVNGSADKSGGGSWGTFSDIRVKKDTSAFKEGLSVIKKIHPVYYKYNGKAGIKDSTNLHIGIIAQQMQSVAPYTVGTYMAKLDSSDAQETQLLNYNESPLFYLFINAFKELDSLNVNKDSVITKLNQKLTHLDSINSALQNQMITNNTSLQNQLNALASTINTCCNENHGNGNHNGEHREVNSNQTNVDLNDAQSIVLEQNIPNPFAEQTAINYSLPDNTIKAQMLFYNAQGKLIQSTELTQKGKGTLNVFASDLSNGIYTYTLVVDGKIIETKKMVKQ